MNDMQNKTKLGDPEVWFERRDAELNNNECRKKLYMISWGVGGMCVNVAPAKDSFSLPQSF